MDRLADVLIILGKNPNSETKEWFKGNIFTWIYAEYAIYNENWQLIICYGIQNMASDTNSLEKNVYIYFRRIDQQVIVYLSFM